MHHVLVLLAGTLTAQVQAQEPDSKVAASPADPEALSARYRFLESYAVAEDPAKPELLTQYQIGSRETIKVTRDKPQGAPEQDETVAQTIYTERVAKVEKGLVTEVVRHYDRSSFRTTVEISRPKAKLLDDLTILYRLQARPVPYVQSLRSRTLRQQEYELIIQQSFLPLLTTIFPRQPSRKGDTWPVARGAAWALLGLQPLEEDYGLMAEILEIRKNEPGKTMTAVISVKGPCVVPQGPSAINAKIEFTFEPSSAATPATARPPRGWRAGQGESLDKDSRP